MKRLYMPRSFDYRSLEIAETSSYLSPQQMENHAVARMRCSLIAGVDLALLKANGILKSGNLSKSDTSLSASGAKVQDDKGDRANHAAHVLPCGISWNGVPIHNIPPSQNMQVFIAEPYRYTNILPRAANEADRRAEIAHPDSGKGLILNFEHFCQRIVQDSTAPRGKVDRSFLINVFNNLLQDYCCSFERALSNSRDVSSENVKTVAGTGVELESSTQLDKADIREDDIRTALRTQLQTLKEFGPTGFSLVLVDQVENDFHAELKAGENQEGPKT